MPDFEIVQLHNKNKTELKSAKTANAEEAVEEVGSMKEPTLESHQSAMATDHVEEDDEEPETQRMTEEELDEKLVNPHCSVTKDGRCEVTAKGAVTGKRIFITTVKVSCYGPKAVDHMNKLVKHIEVSGCKKNAALALKRLLASTV